MWTNTPIQLLRSIHTVPPPQHHAMPSNHSRVIEVVEVSPYCGSGDHMVAHICRPPKAVHSRLRLVPCQPNQSLASCCCCCSICRQPWHATGVDAARQLPFFFSPPSPDDNLLYSKICRWSFGFDFSGRILENIGPLKFNRQLPSTCVDWLQGGLFKRTTHFI